MEQDSRREWKMQNNGPTRNYLEASPSPENTFLKTLKTRRRERYDKNVCKR